jgi:hypothetical protein
MECEKTIKFSINELYRMDKNGGQVLMALPEPLFKPALPTAKSNDSNTSFFTRR